MIINQFEMKERMKMKKRIFAFLTAMALCITIGGVYATWNYAQSSAGAVTREYNLMLTSETIATSKGTIALSSSGFTLELDQKSDTDYTAVLKMTGDLSVTFTPAAGADADVRENGIVLQATFTETYGNYSDTINHTPTDNTDILVVSEPFTLNEGQKINGTYTLNNDVLKSKLTLGNIQLETKDEYDAFKTLLASGKLTLTIGEYIPTT